MGIKELAVSSALARLVGGLKREQHDYRASLEVFPALNVAKLAADLAVGKMGAQRGANEEPSSDSAVFDDIETRIIERVEAEKNSAHGIVLDELHLYKRTGPLNTMLTVNAMTDDADMAKKTHGIGKTVLLSAKFVRPHRS